MSVSRPQRLPELLAPAGDEDCLRAAVANGADAVYFGLDDFNARRRAANFSLAGLPELVDWLHRRNVRAYIAFNTLVFSAELERAAEYFAGVAAAGVDALIVQDLGILRLARAMCPTLPLHASTQTTQTHPAGIAVLKSLGVSRVILARELSLEQIAAIAQATDVELEVFVHGAICISFSGQCLASEVMWGRSANRGLCAQACRLPYALTVNGAAAPADERPYPLSPRDLCAAGLLDELARLGIAGLKIEGRLKSAAYVASATRVYREVLDNVAAGRAARLTREQELELTLSFSRGFTTGFLGGARAEELVDGRFPRSRGLLVGRVEGRTRRGVLVRLDDEWRQGDGPLAPGDGVVFDAGGERSTELGGRVYEVHRRGKASPQVELVFGREDVDISAVAVGSAVWKTDDPALRRELERSGRKVDAVRRALVDARVEAAVGRPLRLSLRDADGREVAIESVERLEAATRHPLTVELLREQLGRLGDSPFELRDAELVGPEGCAASLPVMAPKSVLNELRRQAVELLLAERAVAGRHAVVRPEALRELREQLGRVETPPPAGLRTPAGLRQGDKSAAVTPPGPPLLRGGECGAVLPAVSTAAPAASTTRPLVSPTLAEAPTTLSVAASAGAVPRCSVPWAVLVRSLEQLAALLDAAKSVANPPSLVYLELPPDECAAVVSAVRGAGLAVGAVTPVVMMPGDERLLDALLALRPEVVLVRNLAAAAYLHARAADTALVADYALNAANELTAATLAEHGLARVTPAYDLSAAQSAAMRARSPGGPAELIVHGHVPEFHTAHPLAGADARGVGLCQRDGREHPLMVDAAGRTTVFSVAVQSALGVWADALTPVPACVRVELLRESADQTRMVLSTYAGVLAGALPCDEAQRRLEAVYTGGVITGTLAG